MWCVLFVTALIVPVTLPHSFPEKFERCHLNDANLDNCIKTTIQNAIHLLGTSGISSLNLPAIEPLEATKLEIKAGSNAVNLVQKYKDVKIYGYMNSSVENAHLDLDKKILTFTTYIPELIQKAHYDVDGKIMMMPIFGSGDSTIILYGLTIKHIINFKEEISKGKKHFKITSYETRMTVKDLHIDLQNLFNGDKQLADNILKAINDNGVALFEDAKEGIQNAYAEIYRNVATRLFHNIPVDEIFLP